MRTQSKADILLIFATICWGSSYILTKLGLGAIDEFNLIALRFTIAFILSGLFFIKRIIKTTEFKALLSRSAIIGFILFITFALNNFGIRYTTASNAGFLTCLAGLFVPFIAYFISKEIIEKKIIISIIFSVVGIYLLTVGGEMFFKLGDLLCILCSLFFALHIVMTGKFTKDVDSVSLGVFQLGFVGLYSAVASFIFETPILPPTKISWLVVILLSVFCSGAAFIIQTVAQKYTTPSHTGIIFSLEPVFAVIFVFTILGETLVWTGYIGAVLMFVSIIIIETRFIETIEGKLRKKGCE